MREAAFKYTVPIEKALVRDDGVKVLVGLATGPEVDGDGERVTEEAIWSFAKQINDNPGTIPFRDAHAKDGVFRDLGFVTKAWVTDSGHLGVEVELETDNPAANWLHTQIQKGKKFGMSVAGKVIDWAFEYAPEIGKSVRTFRNVVLSEVSSTTRPSWSHSLGTVIAKAIQDAEESESDSAAGDNVDNDELQTEQETTETPAADENTEVEATAEEAVTEEAAAEEAVEETPEVEAEAEAAEETETPAEGEATADEETTDEAEAETEETPAEEEAEEPAAENDVVAQMRAIFATFHNNLTEMLTGMGVEMTPVMVNKSVSTDENAVTFEKALSDATAPLQEQIGELQKSLNEATARIEELENSPAGDDSPDMVEKHVLTSDDIAKAMDSMTPSDRLRLGLRFGLKPGR